MKKKFLSVFLTGVMVIGSCVVSFADVTINDQTQGLSSTIEAESELEAPVISVVVGVPENANLTANPYKLKLEDANNTKDSMVGVSYTVTNGSDCEILLSVNGSVTAEGGTKIATTKDAAEKAAVPTVFVQAFVKSGDKYQKVDSKTKDLSDATATDTDPYAGATPLVYAAKAVAYTGNIVMQRASEDADDETPTAAAVTIDVVGATGGVGWTESYTFKASTVLNVAPSTSAANIKRTAAASSGGGSSDPGSNQEP